jgi:hypothetical protein
MGMRGPVGPGVALAFETTSTRRGPRFRHGDDATSHGETR